MNSNLSLSKPWYVLIPELFHQCHLEKIFDDGKLIADALPNVHIVDIKNNYYALKKSKFFDLKEFFTTFFTLPESPSSHFIADVSKTLEEHIKSLWPLLTRNPDKVIANSSLIPLPYKYVVPGGRFTEIYYWDSYFTMLGLKVHGEIDLIQSMIDNFTYLIDNIGYIPNGNRHYYIGRSQPPFYSHMISLLADINGMHIYKKYRESLQKEHEYWMSAINQKAINLSEDEVLNRNYDINDTPRYEMYQEDVELSQDIVDKQSFYRHIRSACESGWDFSSRWFVNDSASTIITNDILPVDLNCLLYHLEVILSHAFGDDDSLSSHYFGLSSKRKNTIQKYFWSAEVGCYYDYNFVLKSPIYKITAAIAYPLFVKIADAEQAASIANIIEQKLLKSGGIVTTEFHTGQQWDAPNGWAPLQWIAYIGLLNYGYNDLANQIKTRWITLNEKVYQTTGKMMEKYNVEDLSLDAGGGEYPVQDGFGWSNGVYVAMKNMVEL